MQCVGLPMCGKVFILVLGCAFTFLLEIRLRRKTKCEDQPSQKNTVPWV